MLKVGFAPLRHAQFQRLYVTPQFIYLVFDVRENVASAILLAKVYDECRDVLSAFLDDDVEWYFKFGKRFLRKIH